MSHIRLIFSAGQGQLASNTMSNLYSIESRTNSVLNCNTEKIFKIWILINNDSQVLLNISAVSIYHFALLLVILMLLATLT